MGFKINGKPVSLQEARRVAEGKVFEVKIGPECVYLNSVNKYWKDQVFWACGFGVLIGLGLALGLLFIMHG